MIARQTIVFSTNSELIIEPECIIGGFISLGGRKKEVTESAEGVLVAFDTNGIVANKLHRT